MAAETINRTSITFLDESTEGQVCVIPKDRDVFILTVEDAVRACRASADILRFQDQFASLLDCLNEWIVTHRDRIKSAHLTIRESDILFLVVQKQIEFDQELVDALTDFDLHVANSAEFDLIKLNTLSVPPVSADSTKAFLASGRVDTYAKESGPPRGSGRESANDRLSRPPHGRPSAVGGRDRVLQGAAHRRSRTGG